MDHQESLQALLANTTPSGECLLWAGHKNAYGYGKATMLGREVTVTRLVYELQNGPIHSWMCICHKCDVPECINPDHLFLGTQGDNVRDAQRKGRLVGNRYPVGRAGASNGGAKLSEEQAREIFTARQATGETYQSLADRFGVGHTTVVNLCKGKRWKHLAASLAHEAGAAS